MAILYECFICKTIITRCKSWSANLEMHGHLIRVVLVNKLLFKVYNRMTIKFKTLKST